MSFSAILDFPPCWFWFKKNGALVVESSSNQRVAGSSPALSDPTEQHIEPQTAPDVQVGTLHGSLRHRCVIEWLNEWVNVKYVIVKQCSLNVILPCKSLWIKASAKWLNVNVKTFKRPLLSQMLSNLLEHRPDDLQTMTHECLQQLLEI